MKKALAIGRDSMEREKAGVRVEHGRRPLCLSDKDKGTHFL